MIRPKLLTVSGDTDIYIGEQKYITGGGTFKFKVPQTVTRIHAVCIGAGAQGSDEWSGGGGGGLGWANNIEVEPDEILTVQVGAVVGTNEAPDDQGASWIKRTDDDGNPVGTNLVAGYSPAEPWSYSYAGGGDFFGDGGGNGGNGSLYKVVDGYVGPKGSGGGAGGYRGDGGNGTTLGPNNPASGGGGSGGASHIRNSSGSTNGNRGGGVGIYGEGPSGAPARTDSSEWTGRGYEAYPGKTGLPGSGGEGNQFGAGGAGNRDGWNGQDSTRAGHGAVRIIWGNRFSYPDNADINAE